MDVSILEFFDFVNRNFFLIFAFPAVVISIPLILMFPFSLFDFFSKGGKDNG